MLPADSSWLDDGDKIASIVSALIAFVSLTVSLLQGRRSAQVGQTSVPRRWRLTVTGACALLGLGALALVVWAPTGLRPAGVVLGGLAAVVAIVVTGSSIVAWLSGPKRLDPAVRRLLHAQLAQADFHRYQFGSLHLPGVSLIYVEQRLGTVRYRQAASRILDIREFVKASPRAIVIGAPGAGKSTFAAHVIGTAARWWTQARVVSRIGNSPFGRLLPVLLPAKDLVVGDVAHALALQWTQANVTSELFTRPPHRRTDWLIIVDSLDEISSGEARMRVIQTLGAFIASGTGSHLIVTSRALTAGELADLVTRGAQEYHLRLFGRDELLRFATRWFAARGGGVIDADAEAKRFLGHVRAAGLTSIVRVPLLATIAVLVYETDRDRMLPTSRTGLYHEFIWLLRGARDLPSATPIETWLAANLDRLLRELAAARVRDDSLRLLPWADRWVTANIPFDLLHGSEAERVGMLRNSLIASGLCSFAPSFSADDVEADVEAGAKDGDGGPNAPGDDSPRVGNDVEFVHFTVAEYLAADPAVHTFSYDEFRSLMAHGRTRGFSLFGLARSAANPARIVDSLLVQADPVTAGRIIADGMPVDAELRQRVIDTLISRVTGDHPTVAECVDLLADLATDSAVMTRLQALVTDSNQTLWARVFVADTLADLDPDGPLLLRTLVAQSSHGDAAGSGAIWWARQRLAARDGSTLPIDETVPLSGLKSIGEIGRQACIRTATDSGQAVMVRLRAARILYEAGYATGADVLHELIDVPSLASGSRLEIARLLTTRRDGRDGGVRALQALAIPGLNARMPVPFPVRHEAANELLEQGDPVGLDALHMLARDSELSKSARRQVVEQLAARDDPLGRELLAEIARQEARQGAFIRSSGALLVLVAPVAFAAASASAARQWLLMIGLFAMMEATLLLLIWTNSTWQHLIDKVLARQNGMIWRPFIRALPADPLDRLAATVEASSIINTEAPANPGPSRRDSLSVRTRLAVRGRASSWPPVFDLAELVSRMADQPRQSAVILGSPGSGKTALAKTLVRELLHRRDAVGAVPVLVPLRGWLASDRRLKEWVVDSLSKRTLGRRAMSADDVTELMATGRILPVFDGLDEAPSSQMRRAVQEISAMSQQGASCVVTCRKAEYEQLVAEHGGVNPAVVVEILPLRSLDVAEFIVNNVERTRLKAWAPVLRELRRNQNGEFAKLMSHPMVVAVALRPYLRTDTDLDPEGLLRRVYSRDRRGAGVGDFLTDFFDDLLGTYVGDARSTLLGYAATPSMRWLATIARQTQLGAYRFNWRSVQGWLEFPVLRAVALVTATPPLIAAAVGMSSGAVSLLTVMVALGLVCGLLMLSSRIPGGSARSDRFIASSGVATQMSAIVASMLAGGAALLGYAGTGEFGDAVVLAVTGAMSFWTTEAGRFQLARAWLALTGRLPWTLEQFFTATTRAGITTYDGTAYEFAHAMILENLVKGP